MRRSAYPLAARAPRVSVPLRRALVTLCAASGCALLALTGLPAPAHAETASPSAGNPTLDAFGGRAGLGLLAEDLVQRLLADPRTQPFFNGLKKKDELVTNLADQFCAVLDGPCVYRGKDMKLAHAEMEIHKADFNALVEVLQQAMAARGVPFGDQNRLLARLAPMHREMLTAP